MNQENEKAQGEDMEEDGQWKERVRGGQGGEEKREKKEQRR